jgi:hypothetical protein
MKSTQTLNFVKLAACMILIFGLSTSAIASCGDSLSAMAAAAAAVAGQSNPMQSDSQSPGNTAVKSSIVGLWHVQFQVGGQTIQEAFQIWNGSGTEVHNPNVDPRGGDVCLGVWKRVAPNGTYQLAHRVWNYDMNGNFMGTINLSETLTLGHSGKTQSGSFTSDFYDPSGKFLMEVSGSVIGRRISVD